MYTDLLESLEKNDAVKDYVVKTVVEKGGGKRTVKKMIDVMAEKYAKTLSQKTQ